MHHRSSASHPAPAVRRHGPYPCSPLGAVDAAFLALADPTRPLTLPTALLQSVVEVDVLPVDQVRARLVHPSTRPEVRTRIWREVVRRAQVLGEPWSLVALGMAIPAVRRQLVRLPRPLTVWQLQEVEQEALTALAHAISTADVQAEALDWDLLRACDRAIHRLRRVEQRHHRSEVLTDGSAVHLGRLDRRQISVTGTQEHKGGEECDEYGVLAAAVDCRVIDVAEAQLIARSRLEGVAMGVLAGERGVSLRQVYRYRTAAEQRLAAHLAALALEA
ncbi:hypothetical protein [Streptomyces sp. NPDC050738]|uniref:hypothetical protein n=1 Tax=Streptomyces sp. NPDC050738 TaxID=3154744 RepID=UPI003433F404